MKSIESWKMRPHIETHSANLLILNGNPVKNIAMESQLEVE